MKFQAAAAILAFAGSAIAAPTCGDDSNAASTFKIKAIAAGSEVNSRTFSASQNNIFAALESQGAVCQRGSQEDATFYIRDGKLFLYSTDSTAQQLYADRSGMGQGKLGYIREGQSAPKNAELTGWSIDESGNLNLRGTGFIACPNSLTNGAWHLWVNAGYEQPGGGKDCIKVTAQKVEDSKPISCFYSEM